MTGSQKILDALSHAEVNFILVGAYAAIAHGAQSQPDDLDICYECSKENYRKLMKAFEPLNARLVNLHSGLDAALEKHSLAHGTNFTLRTDVGRLDLVGEISGVGGYRDLLPHSVEIQIEHSNFRIASLNDLIRIKEAGTHPKDHFELLELLALRDRNAGIT